MQHASSARWLLWVGIAASLGRCTVLGDEALFPQKDVPPKPASDATGDGASVIKAVPDAVQAIFTASCLGAGCHSGASPQSKLGLDDAETSYKALVGVSALGKPGAIRVKPKDAASSYLMLKLDGTAQPMMPLGRPPLSAAQLATVKAWIDALEDTAPVPNDVVQPADPGAVTPDPGPSDAPTVPDPEVPANVQAIFAKSCGFVGCHGGPNATSGLRLDSAAESWKTTVNVPALAGAGKLRIVPKDPDASYLVQKLTGVALPMMPQGGKLDPADLQVIVDWVKTLELPIGPGNDLVTPVDTGPPDVGPVDAGPVDAGPVDSGPDIVFVVTPTPKAVQDIFDDKCTPSCHSGVNPSNGLNLESGKSAASLIGKKADSKLYFVLPGDPSQSELYLKVTGVSKPTMPLGKPLLEQEAQDTIKNWIKSL